MTIFSEQDKTVLEKVREEFIKLLTVDSETLDARRRDFNVSLFAPREEGGHQRWTALYIEDITEKFDKAVKNVSKK